MSKMFFNIAIPFQSSRTDCRNTKFSIRLHNLDLPANLFYRSFSEVCMGGLTFVGSGLVGHNLKKLPLFNSVRFLTNYKRLASNPAMFFLTTGAACKLNQLNENAKPKGELIRSGCSRKCCIWYLVGRINANAA